MPAGLGRGMWAKLWCGCEDDWVDPMVSFEKTREASHYPELDFYGSSHGVQAAWKAACDLGLGETSTGEQADC